MTPRQLKVIKAKYPRQDDNVILLAVLYLERNLSPEDFTNSASSLLDEAFTSEAPASLIALELKNVIATYQKAILPAITKCTFNNITVSDAIRLSVRLIANSSYELITSTQELAFSEDHQLRGLSQLVERAFDEKNNTSPSLIITILNNLFTQIPGTESISDFTELMLQAALADSEPEEEPSILSYIKDKPRAAIKINPVFLNDARAAFRRWKKDQRNYAGLLCKIARQADLFAGKYPAAQINILEYCFEMFREMLVDPELLPDYFAEFVAIINALIGLDNKQIVYSLCFHLANKNAGLEIWTLIELFNHHVFKQFSFSQQHTLLSVITNSLNHNLAVSKDDLRYLLNRCENFDARIAIMQCLNAFYLRPPFPAVATFVGWVKLVPEKNIQSLYGVLADNYIKFNDPAQRPAPVINAPFEKQLNKLRRDLSAYANTSIVHKRKARAAYLNELVTEQLSFIDNKSADEKQKLQQQVITELYLHYLTIEDASGLLSRALEKRLIMLLQIPNDDTLRAARAERKTFSYKFHNFFRAGRAFFKGHHDKTTDPVHAIIRQHLPAAIIGQLNNLQQEVIALDRQDKFETTWFSCTSTPERLEEINEKITQRLG